MRARVSLTPDMLRRLSDGKSLFFKVAPGVSIIEILPADKAKSPIPKPFFDSVFDQIDKAFNEMDKTLDKIWKKSDCSLPK
jgi:hypothetical protein